MGIFVSVFSLIMVNFSNIKDIEPSMLIKINASLEYYLETGEKKKAKETFDFVIKTVGKHHLLGEQIDNNTLKPNWVIGLGWSHAMFIIVLEKLYGREA